MDNLTKDYALMEESEHKLIDNSRVVSYFIFQTYV